MPQGVRVKLFGCGSKKLDLSPKYVKMTFSRRQVLSSSGETSWRKLIGKLLLAFVRSHGGSNAPLINPVTFEAEPDGDLPIDVLECWATCFGAAFCATVMGNGWASRLLRYCRSMSGWPRF